VIYLDTSAFVKLIRGELETPALHAFLHERPRALLVSNALLVAETRRAILRHAPDQLARADLLLTRIDKVDITRAVLEAPADCPIRRCGRSTPSTSPPPSNCIRISRRW
jgi:uncharacterized protein